MTFHPLILVLVAAGVAPAAGAPTVHQASAPSGSSEEILATELVIPITPVVGRIVSRQSPPEPGVHDGEITSVAGPRAPRVLTEGERAKLEAARHAVEAARAAGTLLVQLRPSTATATDRADDPVGRAAAQADPALAAEAGIGVRVPPVAGNPFAPLTEWERAKLDGLVVPLPEHFPPRNGIAADPPTAVEPQAEGGAR